MWINAIHPTLLRNKASDLVLKLFNRKHIAGYIESRKLYSKNANHGYCGDGGRRWGGARELRIPNKPLAGAVEATWLHEVSVCLSVFLLKSGERGAESLSEEWGI